MEACCYHGVRATVTDTRGVDSVWRCPSGETLSDTAGFLIEISNKFTLNDFLFRSEDFCRRCFSINIP